jgi:hypothetical protein
MVALSGTLLVVYQIYAVEHDSLFFLWVTHAYFQNEFFMFFSINSFLGQFLVLCVASWIDGFDPFLI